MVTTTTTFTSESTLPDLTPPTIKSETDLPPPARIGYVSTAPSGLGQPFNVTIPDFDGQVHAFEIRRWQARAMTIPAVGDQALVILDDAGEPWVPAWWPAAGDVAFVGPKDFGIVEALPGTAAKGDLCTYRAAAGVYWQLILTKDVAETPWNKIGGAALVKESNTERTLTNQVAYASLPTDPLKITVPLKGEYDTRIEAVISPPNALSFGTISYAVGATAANDNWCAALTVTNTSAADVGKTTRQTGVAAAAEIIEKARTGGNYTVGWNRRRLIVDPVRVG
jgi:hypothetical protein